MDYRHELKFLVSCSDLQRIGHCLQDLMAKDSHLTGDTYTVRSLYFDDLFDSCLEEVLSGVDDRRKFRIRLYNGDSNMIRLEKKEKHRGMTRKKSERISNQTCLEYIEGLPVIYQGKVSQELFTAALRQGMRPKCIVEYERTAYVEEIGNVRITFDMDIRGTSDITQFLEKSCQDCTYCLPPGQHILEVKFDEFLPDHLLQVLDLNTLRRTSFSKYAYVRNATI